MKIYNPYGFDWITVIALAMMVYSVVIFLVKWSKRK